MSLMLGDAARGSSDVLEAPRRHGASGCLLLSSEDGLDTEGATAEGRAQLLGRCTCCGWGAKPDAGARQPSKTRARPPIRRTEASCRGDLGWAGSMAPLLGCMSPGRPSEV